MKKLLIIITFILLGYNSQAKEPTKQETMDWIASKLISCWENTQITKLDYGIDNVSIFYEPKYAATFFYYTFSCTYYFPDGRKHTLITPTIRRIDFSKITRVVSSNQSIGLYGIDYSVKQEDKSWKVIDLNRKFELSTDKGTGDILLDFECEPDLQNRMVKAFETLAKHNNANKPKEKF